MSDDFQFSEHQARTREADRTFAPIPMREVEQDGDYQYTEGKPRTAAQEIKARGGIRRLQDKILDHPASKKFVADHGDHAPIFEGGPSTVAMRAYVHMAHESKLHQIHNDLYGKNFK